MIISIINQKGGVGKTTTAINLGAALSSRACRVLLIDLDTQQSLSSYDGAAIGATITAANGRTLTKALNDYTAGEYDFALIDCPPTLGAECAAALKVAQLAIAPTPPRFLDVMGFSQLRETVQAARERGNNQLRLKILLTLRESRSTLQNEYEVSLRQSALGRDVLSTVIPKSASIERATDRHLSAVHFSPRSVGAHAYQQLADEVLQYVDDK